MRSVGDIIKARMPAIGLRFNTDLAEAIVTSTPRGEKRIDTSNIGRQISGERTIPVEHVAVWQRALQLVDEAADEFDLAVRVTHSDDKVRDLLRRTDLELAKARSDIELYEERIQLLAGIANALNEMRKRRTEPAPPLPPPHEPPAA